jgi:hypothetical protein
LQRQVLVCRFGLAGREDVAGHGGQVEWFSVIQSGLPARQREQRVDELLLLGAGGEYSLMGGAERFDGGAGVCQGDLADDPLPGQRGAQLVRGVGDELALGAEGCLEPCEQPVDGVAEVFELIAGAGNGQPGAQVVLGDLPCGRARINVGRLSALKLRQLTERWATSVPAWLLPDQPSSALALARSSAWRCQSPPAKDATTREAPFLALSASWAPISS